jgi:hypothetical protein
MVNVVVAVTGTLREPFKATDPTPWSILAVKAFEDVHVNVTLPPPAGRVPGVAENVPVGVRTGALLTEFTRARRRGSFCPAGALATQPVQSS